MTTAKKVPIRYYRFRNRLRDKAMTGFVDDGSPGAISTEALDAAEAEFDKMAEGYPDWVQGHIETMYDHYRHCVEKPKSRRMCFRKLTFIAHDMRGQGGTFGYDLISIVGGSLYEFADFHKDGKIEDKHVELVGAHIDAMKALIAGRINGDGGAVGKELLNSLEKAKEKYANAH